MHLTQVIPNAYSKLPAMRANAILGTVITARIIQKLRAHGFVITLKLLNINAQKRVFMQFASKTIFLFNIHTPILLIYSSLILDVHNMGNSE